MNSIGTKALTIFLILFLSACSSQKVSTNENVEQPLEKELEELNIPQGEMGSARPEDREKRLNYLQKLITEKNSDLKLIEDKDIKKTAEEELKAEILTNEILLLEAYRFGIESGLELNEIQTP